MIRRTHLRAFVAGILIPSLVLIGRSVIGAAFPTDPDLQFFAGNSTAETRVSISGTQFLVNGRATHDGRSWNGVSLSGRLLNVRAVNVIYDDLDGSPPSGMLPWDPRLNTFDFVQQMPSWAAQGLDAITLNLQGGSNRCNGISGGNQRAYVDNNPFGASGTVAFSDWWSNRDTRAARYLARLGSVIREADDLGLVVVLGLFYFGQDSGLASESAVLAATDAATDWVLANGWTNVLIEISNEGDIYYDHAILRPARVAELIRRVQARSGGRLKVSTSLSGGTIPPDAIISQSDFVLLHGNQQDAARIRSMVDAVRARSAYTAKPKPIVFNEDSTSTDNFKAAVGKLASWGYFDSDGYQCVYPSTTGDRYMLSKATNRAFWPLLKEMAAGTASSITQSGSQAVSSFTLIDADTDQPIAGFNPIPASASLDLARLSTKRLNIRANTTPSLVGSVRFKWNSNSTIENGAPYALAGNDGADYLPWTPQVGSHTLTATPYTHSHGGGSAGQPLTVALAVVNGSTTTTSGPAVSSFTLINADTHQPVAGYDPLPKGATLNLATLPTTRLNIRANTSPAVVGSVRFRWDATTVMENSAPYALAGDSGPQYYKPWTPQVGSHTLTATPYTGTNGSGTAGRSLGIDVTVTNSSTSGQAVTSLTLMNADTDQPVSGYNPIPAGATISLSTLPTRRLNIRANTSPTTVGSVRFRWNGAVIVEDLAPYALAGNTGNDYWPWTPTTGTHTFEVTPFTGAKATGTAGKAVTLQFVVK